MQLGGPVDADSRIGELDVIRGFALFGVLWMNLYEHAGLTFPVDQVIPIVPQSVDTVVTFFSRWLVLGKAQALFSLLFGFGFALFLSRAEAAGRNGTRLYLRRVSFLLVLGLADALLVWIGDILQAYAMMGFLLIFARRWPNWLLLTVGIALTIVVLPAYLYVATHILGSPGEPLPANALQDLGAARRMPVFLGHDYVAFVRELWIALTTELYFTAYGFVYPAWVFGRFLIGFWFFRQGWMQGTARHAAGFRRWAVILMVAGLVLAGFNPLLGLLGMRPEDGILRIVGDLVGTSAQVVLALGYAALLVTLCQSRWWRNRLAGLAATGRMALTNYLTQSLFYFFVLYGFGAGLMLYASPTFALVVAVSFFALQMVFSRWWLARYRFGPAEWVWRSWTYGGRQPMLRNAPVPATA